jgi:hypothetical protein
LILILHLFVEDAKLRSFSRVPARAPLLKRNVARMASPPNEIPFFVIKAAMVAVRTKEKAHDEHSDSPL